ITLVMSAVFIPVAFMEGPVGIFYRQFSITLAIAIVISGINALTLTPALCALILENHYGKPKNQNLLQKFYARFNNGYEWFALKYRRSLGVLVGRKLVTVLVLGAFFAGTWGMARILPSGFIPVEDQSMIYINVSSPVGATVERTEKVLDEIQPLAEQLEEVASVSTLAGYSLSSGLSGAAFGMGMINLKNWNERETSIQATIQKLDSLTRHISDAEVTFFLPPTVSGFGNSSGFQMKILDQTGSGNLQKISEVTGDFAEELMKAPEIGYAYTDFDADYPQYMVHVDQDIAAKKGVSIQNAMSSLQVLMGGQYISNFVRFENMYDVMVQAAPQYRAKPEDVLKVQVKNNLGEMVPISTFVKMEKVYGPEQLEKHS